MQYITVDLRDRKQLYEQLIDNIRKLILSGEIGPGEKLPSVRALAKELSVGCLWLDSNISEVLPEPAREVCTFRKLAGALALQGLLSTWVLPALCRVSDYTLDLHDSCRYDLLTVHCAQTESLKVWLSDAQYTAEEKQAALEKRASAGLSR